MKQELKQHLPPLLLVFFITAAFWVLASVAWYEYLLLFLGLAIGAFFLDFDHLIYWLYTHPNLLESRLARAAIAKRDYTSVIKLLEATHKTHTNLIFHHYFFQILLTTISLYIFTSTNTTLGKAILLAINIHLLVDQFVDLKLDPGHLQDWLFARSKKQLPKSYLQRYLSFFAIVTLFFLLLLIKSRT